MSRSILILNSRRNPPGSQLELRDIEARDAITVKWSKIEFEWIANKGFFKRVAFLSL